VTVQVRAYREEYAEELHEGNVAVGHVESEVVFDLVAACVELDGFQVIIAQMWIILRLSASSMAYPLNAAGMASHLQISKPSTAFSQMDQVLQDVMVGRLEEISVFLGGIGLMDGSGEQIGKGFELGEGVDDAGSHSLVCDDSSLVLRAVDRAELLAH
jgi:hypothetical protein